MMEPEFELEFDLVQSQMHKHFGDSPDPNNSQNVDQQMCHRLHGEDSGIHNKEAGQDQKLALVLSI
jgi:hypothetical protein